MTVTHGMQAPQSGERAEPVVGPDGPPLRIVHIISGLGHGGAETVLYRLVTHTGAPSPMEHIVISMGDEGLFGPRLREAGIAVHALGMHGVPGTLRGLRRLFMLLRQLQPDVVQTWMYHADLIGGVVARLAGVRAVSWGIRNSGADLALSSKSSRWIAALCAPLSRFVPAVIVACAHNAMQRHRQWGYDADRMRVVSNGYDVTHWRPDAEIRDHVRAQWHIPAGTAVLGCVARWNPLKDHANLIAALGRLRHTHPAWRAVLIGDGMDSDNGELTTLLRQYGVRDQVMLLGRRDDVPRLIQGMDVHVLPSRAEGFPNVVAEAMAAGVPAVVTDVGDAARIVGDTGWVVPARDSYRLAGALAAAVDESATPDWAARRTQARERIVQNFSLVAMVREWQLTWQRLAQDYPRRGAPLRRDPRHGGRLLMVVNNPAFFLSHRLPLALAARAHGLDVHIATMDGPSVARIQEHGFVHHAVPMTRSGRNPVGELATLAALWRLFRRVRPDIVHAVTIKPVLYGGIAARLARVPAYVAAVSGLGYVFTRRPARFDLMRLAATRLYGLALAHPVSRVIFQNQADCGMLTDLGVLRPGQAVIVPGSGVDLSEFRPTPEPSSGPCVALCVARLLKDKGILEFVEAARLSRDSHPVIVWQLAGSPDPGNPASVTLDQVRQWHQEGLIQWLGEREDIAALYQQAHIAVLPSYREGLPKSLIEAAASGRAIVTTDVPGCRDTVRPGASGILVPPRNAAALAHAVQTLAMDDERRHAMGRAGRQLAERRFDLRLVVQQQLDVYDALLRPSRGDPLPPDAVQPQEPGGPTPT